MNYENIIVGVKYEVKPKKTLSNPYSKYKFIKMDSCKEKKSIIFGYESEDSDGVQLIYDDYTQCKNFIDLFFEVEPLDEFNLRDALQTDAYALSGSENPAIKDISERIKEALHYIMPVDSDWEFESILESYFSNRKNVSDDDYEQRETLLDTYVRLLKLQFKIKYGSALLTSYFLSEVEDGTFTDDDGWGDYYTANLQKGPSIEIWEDSIRDNASMYPFVVWYNK